MHALHVAVAFGKINSAREISLTLKDSSEGDQTHANKSPMHVMASNSLQSMQLEEVSGCQNLVSLTSRVGDVANGSLAPTPQIQDASTISFHHPHPASVPLTHLHNDQDVCRLLLVELVFAGCCYQ